ncbi:MAG: apolipoprotein N-acyltransferase [Bacteroidota bacterium]|jgi:apolipoprotein N-acyltransferase
MLVAFVPLMWTLFSQIEESSQSSVVGPLYVCFFVFHGLCNWWISSWQEQTDPYLLASGIAVWLAHPLLLMLPWLILVWLSKRLSRTATAVLIPVVYTAGEWIHGQTDFSYPWLTVGYSMVDVPSAQMAEVVGVYGISFAIMAVNTLVYAALLHRDSAARSAGMLIFAIVLWVGLSAAGAVRRSSSEWLNKGGGLRVEIVQPNINPWDKWSAPSDQLRIHKAVSDSLRRDGVRADVSLWSETAIPYVIRNYRYIADWMDVRRWVDTSGTTLLTGFADMMVYPDGTAPASARSLAVATDVKYDHFNAAMVVNPGRTDVPVHRKTMLTPFAERLPFADQLSFAMKWFEWGVGISAWGQGRERHPLPVIRNGDTIARIGTIICIESIYPDVARDMVNNGADVLAVITNDAWYNGTWGPRQHYDIARMRAIEFRRPVVRCANSGVSGIISADGTSEKELPVLRRMASTVQVRPNNVQTFYARHGDWLAVACAILSLFAVVIARFSAVLRILPAFLRRQSSNNSVDA